MAQNIEALTVANDGYLTVRTNAGPPTKFPVIGSVAYATTFSAGIVVSGGTTGVAISGTTTGLTSTDPITVTLTGETSSHIGITSTIAASATYTGWALGVFGTTTLSGTLGTVGQAAGGIFELNLAAGFAGATSGLLVGAMIGAYANATSGELPTAGLWIEAIAGATVSLKASGANTDMPLLALVTSGGGGVGGNMASLAIEFGSEIAGKTVGVLTGEMYYHQTIQCKANGELVYMPLSTTEGTYTTAYPIITSYNGDPSISIGTAALPLTTATTGMSALKIWSDTTIDDTEYHVPLWVTSILKKTGGGTIYGIRAHTELGATFEADASGTLVGVHGRVRNQGTLSNSGTIMAGVMGQVLHGTGTHTTVSHIASLWADNQLRSDGIAGQHELLYMTNNNSGAGVRTIGQAIFLYGPYVTNFVNFNGCQTGGMVVDGAGDAEARTGRIMINVNGDTRYLYYYD